MLRVRHGTIAEATGIVGTHLTFIVGIIVVGEGNALDGIMGLVKFTEDGKKFGGNAFIADEFTLMGASVVVIMKHTEITQVCALDMGIGLITATLHELPDAIRDGLSSESHRKCLALQAQSTAKPDY